MKSAVGSIERERNDAQRSAGGARQLIDGGAAGGKIRHHLRRHLGRIGRHAEPGHAVIAGEHENLDALQSRRRMALPVREPGDEVFEAAEAARRLGQHGFALQPRPRSRQDARSAGRDKAARSCEKEVKSVIADWPSAAAGSGYV